MTLPANVSIHFKPPVVPGHHCVLLSTRLRAGVRAPASIRDWTGHFILWCSADASDATAACVALAAYCNRAPDEIGSYIETDISVIEPNGVLRCVRPDDSTRPITPELWAAWTGMAKNFSRAVFMK
jgi:hypothetical protein